MSVGNINSTAAGSGARYNGGKPDLALIPAWIVADVALIQRGPTPASDPTMRAWLALHALGDWQKTGMISDLERAIGALQDPLRSAARVFTYGAKKYAAWNWIKGMPWSVPLACAQRHALAMLEGEELDPESGEPHEGHLSCNIIMLMQYMGTYSEGDDITYSAIMPPQDEMMLRDVSEARARAYEAAGNAVIEGQLQ